MSKHSKVQFIQQNLYKNRHRRLSPIESERVAWHLAENPFRESIKAAMASNNVMELLAARHQPTNGDEQSDETPKIDLENIATTPSTVDLITALPSTPIGNSEYEAENTLPPSSNTEEASGIQNTDDTLRTEVDGTGFSLLSDDESKAETAMKKDVITTLPSAPAIDYELEAENMILQFSYTEEAFDFQYTDYTLYTDEDGIGFSLISDDDNDGPQIVIESEDSLFNIRLVVIVSMITPFYGFEPVIHTGSFILDVNPATTIRDIKYGITATLDICYEDMALLSTEKFLSDLFTLQHYMIDDGQTLHLLVETTNKLFKDIFGAFKKLNLNEERAWFATKGFINVTNDKFDNDEPPEITEELLLHKLQQLFVPDSDSDDSNDSTADDNEPEIFTQNVVQSGGVELELVHQVTNQVKITAENETEGSSENEEQYSDDDEQNSEDYSSDDEDETGDEDDDYDFLAQVLAHFGSVKWIE